MDKFGGLSDCLMCIHNYLLIIGNYSAWERRHPWRPAPEAARDGGVPGGKTYA